MKRVFKILGISLLSIIGILVIGLAVLTANSSGKLEPLKDREGKEIAGSLAEKGFIEAGGISQGFFIRSENPENPVILFLHGGPGSPELPFLIPFEKGKRLEKYFTVCYWEQRGAGMSYDRSIDPQSMTLARLVEDTHEMTQYLRERFHKDKIYLMGHSWGSYLGVKTIEKYPEDYFAYIGIGQVTNQRESEKLAYDHMLAHAEETGDKKAVGQLEKFDKNASGFPSNDYIFSVRTRLMNKYNIGVTRESITMGDLVKEVLFFGGYTPGEKIKYARGGMFSADRLFQGVIEDDLFESSVRFEVPVYLLHGKYDYQVSYSLAKDYLNFIDAPAKDFFTFENSAHSPNIEEPEKFVGIVREIASASQ